MLLHGLMFHRTEIRKLLQNRQRWLSDQNIFTNTQAYYMIQLSFSVVPGIFIVVKQYTNNPLVCKHSSGQALDDARPRQHERRLQWTPFRAFPGRL